MLNLLTLGDGAKRDTNVVPGSSDYTCIFRYRIKSTPGGAAYRTAFAFFNDPTYNEWAGIFCDAGTNDFRLSCDNNGSSDFTTTATLTVNTYATIGYRRSGTTQEFYVNGTLVGSFVLDLSAVSFNTTRLGSDGFSDDTDSEYQHFKEWDVALTPAELDAEFGSLAPVKVTDLVSYLTLATNYVDSSGEGNDWSAVGSPSFTTSIPTNTSAGTALYVGTLPASITQTVDAGGTTYEVWYKYTAVTPEQLIGVFGFGDLVTYTPRTRAYSDAGITQLVDTGTSLSNRPIQVAVTPASTYWFRFTPNAGNPTPAVLSLEIETGPILSVPAGSIAINDDTEDFPLIILSGVDGDDYNVLRAIHPFPAGEAADILESGISLWSDAWDGNLQLFDANFNLLNTLPINIGFDISIRANHNQNYFYVGDDAGATISVLAINSSGVTVDTWTLTANASIAGLAANNLGTVLYFANQVDAAPLKQWDLNTDLAMADLVAGIANSRISDILVLTDDTIIVLYYRLGSGDFTVIRYDDAGAVLDTYGPISTDFPAFTFPRLAYAIDNPNSFWVMFHPVGLDITRFRNIKVDDGTTLAEIDSIEYETGVYQAAATATPTARFGNSFSCPFVIMRTGLDVRNTSSGLYELVPDKTNDTLIDEEGNEVNVKIPNPFAITGFLVDK